MIHQWQLERDARGKELQNEIKAIAEHLPRWWWNPEYDKHDGNDNWGEIVGDFGMVLHVNASWHKGRLSISCGWPCDKLRSCFITSAAPSISRGLCCQKEVLKQLLKQSYTPSRCADGTKLQTEITVARDRPPEKIAADINRRLLAWYPAKYQELKQQIEAADARRERQHALAAELKKIIGPTAHRHDHSEDEVSSPNARASVGSDARTKLSLSNLSHELAKEILALCKSRRFFRKK